DVRNLGNYSDDVIHVGRFRGAPLRNSDHSRGQGDLLASCKEARSQCGIHSLREAIIEGKHVTSSGFDQELLLQLADLLRMSRREVFRLAEVVLDVVE